MVREIIREWLGINDIVLALKDVPSAIMLQVAEANQKKRHEETLALINALSMTSDPVKPKIVPKPQRANWKSFRSAAEKASDPQEEQ